MKLRPKMDGIPHVEWTCELPTIPIGKAKHVSQKTLQAAMVAFDGKWVGTVN